MAFRRVKKMKYLKRLFLLLISAVFLFAVRFEFEASESMDASLQERSGIIEELYQNRSDGFTSSGLPYFQLFGNSLEKSQTVSRQISFSVRNDCSDAPYICLYLVPVTSAELKQYEELTARDILGLSGDSYRKVSASDIEGNGQVSVDGAVLSSLSDYYDDQTDSFLLGRLKVNESMEFIVSETGEMTVGEELIQWIIVSREMHVHPDLRLNVNPSNHKSKIKNLSDDAVQLWLSYYNPGDEFLENIKLYAIVDTGEATGEVSNQRELILESTILGPEGKEGENGVAYAHLLSEKEKKLDKIHFIFQIEADCQNHDVEEQFHAEIEWTENIHSETDDSQDYTESAEKPTKIINSEGDDLMNDKESSDKKWICIPLAIAAISVLSGITAGLLKYARRRQRGRHDK